MGGPPCRWCSELYGMTFVFLFCFLLLQKKQKAAIPTITIRATPPTTPPAMAPIWLGGVGGCVRVGEGVLVFGVVVEEEGEDDDDDDEVIGGI
jgi:hypothetical protein